MLTIDQALKKVWYYTVELEQGTFTPGRLFKNIAVTREVLRSINVNGLNAIDISTMEGLFSILLARRGASVMATDTIDNRDKLELLKEIYNVDFNYYCHVPLKGFVEYIFETQNSQSFRMDSDIIHEPYSPYGFDLVVSSGLIYHVLNPIDHIVNYRRLTKTGGLCVLETAAMVSDEIEMVHDWRGSQKAYGGNATWFPSIPALDIFLRSAFFEPLGFLYINSSKYAGVKLVRIAVVARAVESKAFSEEVSKQISKTELYKNYDFKAIFPSARLVGRSAVCPAVETSRLHPASALTGTGVAECEPLHHSQDELTLKLRDEK